MSFLPAPVAGAVPREREQRRRVLARVAGARVTSSIAAAPASIASMSMPCSAAGSRPDRATVSEVRPPTQSHMGKRVEPAAARRPGCRARCPRR